jgi:hypothetical protein
MCQQSLRSLAPALLLLFAFLITPSRAEDQAASRSIQEEIWALPLPLPMFAYLVRPVGDGPFPLVIMNHGVSLNPTDRGSLGAWEALCPCQPQSRAGSPCPTVHHRCCASSAPFCAILRYSPST